MEEEILALLNAVAIGTQTPSQALHHLQSLSFENVGTFAKIDHHRRLRTGFPEVVFGMGKSPMQIVQIMQALAQKEAVVLATRIAWEVYPLLQAQLRGLQYHPTAQIAYLGEPTPQPGTITIVSAGTSDLPVAEEAAVVAEMCGFTVKRLWDVGVAGIHRLLYHQPLLREAEVIIVVAGMDGALASVVGGLANCPVIAVPTSIGYGANFQGLSALLSMLNSCAAGVAVVNIDNGFGAATLAGQILRLAYNTDRANS